MFALRLAARHQGLAHAPIDDLFGVVQVEAPCFNACRCGVASRRIVSPLAEIMPDRCTPEYERILAKMGSLAAYGRAPAWWRKSSLLVIRLRSKRRTAEPFGLVHDWSSRFWPPSHWRPLHPLSHSWSPSMAPCEVHPQLSDTIVRGHVGLRK